jgi:putative aldouronate transport system permease protein
MDAGDMIQTPTPMVSAPIARLAGTKAVIHKKPALGKALRQHWLLYLMLVPSLILLLMFSYYPFLGIGIAFENFKASRGLMGSEWVGLANFVRIFTMRDAWPLFRNTLFIALGKIFIGTFVSLAFSLMLHEIVVKSFKRVVQTMTTLPHFLSWVIIGGIMVQVLSTAGPLNNIITTVFGGRGVKFLGDPAIFPWTIILSDTWKEFGFGAVIYLAALTSINPELYEAAAVDGAGRMARLRFITLPSITSIVVLLACLNLGSILNAGFDQILVLYNPLMYSTGDILDTWVYRIGLVQSDFSVSTAMGLVKSLIGFVLILMSYWMAGKFANYRIF